MISSIEVNPWTAFAKPSCTIVVMPSPFAKSSISYVVADCMTSLRTPVVISSTS